MPVLSASVIVAFVCKCVGKFSQLFVRVLVRAILASLLIVFGLLSVPLAHAETLDWNTRPATNLRTGATDAPTYGAAPTLLTVTTSGAIAGTFDGAGPNILAIEPASTANGTTGYINSTMNALVDDGTSQHITTINFTEPVYNASVIVGDIDGGPTFISGSAAFNDIVEFRAISVTGATVLPTTGTPVNAGIVTWNAATGQALSTNQNVTNNQGDVNVAFAGPIRQLIIRHISGPNSNVTNPTTQFIYIETVTFTRSPTLTVNKQALGGTGTFPLAVNNILNTATTPWSATSVSQNLVVATAGGTTVGTRRILFQTATNTVITETIPTNWAFSGSTMACSDSNSAVSGNPLNFTASVSLSTVIVASVNIRPGAIITCTVVNTAAITTITIAKSWAFLSPGGDLNGNGLADVGDQIVYSYQVQNTGNVSLTNIVVSDVHEGVALPITPSRVVSNETLLSNGPSGPSSDATINGSWDMLSPGSTIRFRYTHTVNLTEFTAG